MPPMSEKAPEQDPVDVVVGQHPPARRALIERLRLLCLALLLCLIALGLSWELWLAPLKGGTGMLALKVAPLMFAISGMSRHRMYTYRWMTLLIWLYVAEGLVRATGDGGLSAWLAGLETVLATALFIACSVYVRQRLKVLPGKQAKTTAGTPG